MSSLSIAGFWYMYIPVNARVLLDRFLSRYTRYPTCAVIFGSEQSGILICHVIISKYRL